MRYFVWLSYDGSGFSGWQYQKKLPHNHTVEGTLEQAFSTLLRQPIDLVASGRTDAGVHATTQVAHFDTEQNITGFTLDNLAYKLNIYLPPQISVNKITEVAPGWHARFDAISRTYTYIIGSKKTPFEHQRVWPYFNPLNIQLMQQCCQLLIGQHDFSSFSRTQTDVDNFYCNIFNCTLKQKENNIILNITANRFLRGMIRAIMGTLVLAGKGKISANDFNQIIAQKNRSAAGPAAPPYGLYLSNVAYPNLTKPKE